MFSQAIATHTAAATLAYITAPSDMCVALKRVVISGDNTTAEQVDIGIGRISALGTPTKTYDNISGDNNNMSVGQADKGDASTTVDCAVDITASEPTYSAPWLVREYVQNQAGFVHEPPGNDPIILSPSESLGIKLLTAISSTNLMVDVEFEEIGG
jgi:hypothetical protein